MNSKYCTNEPATKKHKRDEPHLENRPKLEMVLQVLNACKLQNFDEEKTKYDLLFKFFFTLSTNYLYRQKFINFVEDKDLDMANTEMLDYMRRVKEEHTSFLALQRDYITEHPEGGSFFAVVNGESKYYSDFIINLDNEKSIQDEMDRLAFYKDLLQKRLLVKTPAALKYKSDVVELFQVIESVNAVKKKDLMS